MRLDNTVVNEDGIANQPINDNILKNNIEKNQVKEAKYNELKKGIFIKRSKASTCRELLNQIRNLSSVVYHNDALDHLHDELVKLTEALKFGLEKPSAVRNVSKSSKFSTLPKSKLKKSNLTGTVGISAERKRKARSITVINPKIKKTNIIEEQPCFDLDVHDIPMEETIKDLSNVNDSTTDNDGQKDCLKFDFEILETENKAIPETEELVLEEDILITEEVPASGKITVNRNLKFTNEERNILLQERMLSDESINLAQNLLKEQFPKISGFQDTVIGKTQSFDIVITNENFIQLLHVGSLHWVFLQ